MRPSATPTRLLPEPMPLSSLGSTRCRMPPGSDGSTASANSVFRVLAGGSLRCASCAASTSPVRASATSQDRAERSGSSGASARGRTWVPGRYSSDGRGAAAGPPGAPGSAAARAVIVAGARPRTPTRQKPQVATVIRDENPIVIQAT
ncbi:hypothetical protein SGLAM104S_01240 [Streptomyces glaucescens]